MKCPVCDCSDFDAQIESSAPMQGTAHKITCNNCGWQGRNIPLSDLLTSDPEISENAPAWLHLLTPMQKASREKEIGKGRNPDPYIEQKLIEAGVWPPKKTS